MMGQKRSKNNEQGVNKIKNQEYFGEKLEQEGVNGVELSNKMGAQWDRKMLTENRGQSRGSILPPSSMGKMLKYPGPQIFNKLPKSIVNFHSFHTFKKKVKTHYFEIQNS